MKQQTSIPALSFFCFSLGLSPAIGAAPEDTLQYLEHSQNYVLIKPGGNIVVDLRYASSNNFVGQNLYGGFSQAWLHRVAYIKLTKAARLLQKQRPGYRLKIYDALRPRSVQRVLWQKVKGSAQQKYVARPERGSIHNYGFAVDVSIVGPVGNELDMGTGFDDFRPLSQPRLEQHFRAIGQLSQNQLDNRLLLRTVMTRAGFTQLPLEWWHFDAMPAAKVRRGFSIIE